jgi:hypothetical protein
MPMQLPQSFKTEEGRKRLENYLKINSGNTHTLGDLILLTETFKDASLDLSLEELQELGAAFFKSTVTQTTVNIIGQTNIDEHLPLLTTDNLEILPTETPAWKFAHTQALINKLTDNQKEQLAKLKTSLQESLGEVDDAIVICYACIACKLLGKAELSWEQRASFTSSTPVKFWIAITFGLSLATLPSALISIFTGQSLTQINAWASLGSAVTSTGIGAAIAALFKIRTTTRKRNDALKIANIKYRLLHEHNEEIFDDNFKIAFALIKNAIETEQKKLNANDFIEQRTIVLKEKIAHDLRICDETESSEDIYKIPSLLKGHYPCIKNLLDRLKIHNDLTTKIPDKAKQAEEARQTNGFKFWKYMDTSSGIYTAINVAWLTATVFGSFWAIAKASIIAGGLLAIASGPAFPIVASVVGGALVIGLATVTVYSIYKKWRYDHEQKAINAMVKNEQQKSQNHESLANEVETIIQANLYQQQLELGHMQGACLKMQESLAKKAIKINSMPMLKMAYMQLLSTLQQFDHKLKSHVARINGPITTLEYLPFKETHQALQQELSQLIQNRLVLLEKLHAAKTIHAMTFICCANIALMASNSRAMQKATAAAEPINSEDLNSKTPCL